MLAALVHDIGKALTLFGEEDANVDCMNRVVPPYPSVRDGGLDALDTQWNHDSWAQLRLKRTKSSQAVERPSHTRLSTDKLTT